MGAISSLPKPPKLVDPLLHGFLTALEPPKAAAPTPTPPPPPPTPTDPAVDRRKKEEREAAIRRRGRQSTILTSPLGDPGETDTKTVKLGGTT